MSGKYTPISYPIALNNAPINNDSTIANTFADHFENTLKSNFIPENQEQLLMNIQINCETGNNLPYNNNLTLPEITKTINSVNINSTMGYDNIHNKMIKMLPIQFINLLFITLNNLWIRGTFPEIFKHSILLPLPKPYKDHTQITSHRPISLLSCIGKLYEKIIYNRLLWVIESKDFLPTLQFGFRKMRSCIDALLNIEHRIQKTLREKKIMLICFFDLEKAFDKADHTTLLFRLATLGIKGRLLKVIRDFLQNRTFQVRINSSLSDTKNTSCGVPQGSILSPLIFSILYHNIPVTQNCEISMYADDISAYTIGNTIEEAAANLQTAINEINNWITNSGGKISEEKTTLMYFTRKRITNIPPILLNNTPLNFTTTHKFLGLTLDSPHLTWRDHINNLSISCQKN